MPISQQNTKYKKLVLMKQVCKISKCRVRENVQIHIICALEYCVINSTVSHSRQINPICSRFFQDFFLIYFIFVSDLNCKVLINPHYNILIALVTLC